MAVNEYESELFSVSHEPHDYDWNKAILLGLPTDVLKSEYAKLLKQLKELREMEPAKKRGRKEIYRLWVSRTHELSALLDDILHELNARE